MVGLLSGHNVGCNGESTLFILDASTGSIDEFAFVINQVHESIEDE